jgi:integrase/recombinase XerD
MASMSPWVRASRHTQRAYRGDLLQFAAHHDGEIAELTVIPVRAYLAGIAGLTAASRKRKRASVASFCRWAVRHDLLAANPMDKIDTVKVPRTLPRPAAAADVAKVLAAICSRRPRKDIPLDRLRDRVLFETAYTCGARAAEACGLYAEDLDLRPDDEHVRIHGKGGTVRTVLLDDRGYVGLLKMYLARAGYTCGPVFRASINELRPCAGPGKSTSSLLTHSATLFTIFEADVTASFCVPRASWSPASSGGNSDEELPAGTFGCS